MGQARIEIVQNNDIGQRIDNFIMSKNRSVPKARIYRGIRSGEVRVNMGRVTVSYRIKAGDAVRLPPFMSNDGADSGRSFKLDQKQLIKMKEMIHYEDEDYILINKPPGIAVHAGTGATTSLVEQMTQFKAQPLYLVHRLDKDVSGCLLLAKSRDALNRMIAQWRTGAVEKIYHALVFCDSRPSSRVIDHNLETASGRIQTAQTELECIRYYGHLSLVRVKIRTGRKHQIRRHLAMENLPIVGDKKFGDFEMNRSLQKKSGARHLFLVAKCLEIPLNGMQAGFEVDYPCWWGDVNLTAPSGKC